ncbi:MAG: glycerol kinase GlpK [Bacteroidales bacterium]|nr:glycerol kinase GlpK [Bacteroidales bacterium]
MNETQGYILAIDQSTSASKVMLFDRNANLHDRISIPHEQIYPEPGFVEHNPEEIFENVRNGILKILEKNNLDENNLVAIAITNQRETTMIWDGDTGKPVHNAVVWQCQRGAPFCHELKSRNLEQMVMEKTGLVIDPYFSASKLRWLVNHVPGIRERKKTGILMLGTMDSWLLWKLTAGKVHATDYSNACRTLLFNIRELKWDEELVTLFDLDGIRLPEVRFSDELFGATDPAVLFSKPVPVAGLMGDSHAALFGQNCFEPGMAKATYGTGSSIMMNIGKEPLHPPKGLVTSIGFGRDQSIDYVYEGNIHCTGDTVSWLKNELKLIGDAGETEKIATSVPSSEGVYMVPAFVGLGAPYWDNEARASITGISRHTGKAHVVRAVLESIAYQVNDLIELMQKDEAVQLRELRVDGGPTRNNFLMQFQADMLNRQVVRSSIEEISALGATFMAGLATGFWKNIGEIGALRKNTETFSPAMKTEQRNHLIAGWNKAVERTRLR